MATRFDDLFEDGPEDVEAETAQDVTDLPLGEEAQEFIQSFEPDTLSAQPELVTGTPPLVGPGGGAGTLNALRSLPTRQVLRNVKNIFVTRGAERAGSVGKLREIVERLMGTGARPGQPPATDVNVLIDNLIAGPATSIVRSEAGQQARRGAELVLQDLKDLLSGDTGE